MTTQTTASFLAPDRYPSSILDLTTWAEWSESASGSGVYAALNPRLEPIDKTRPRYIGSTLDCQSRFRNHHAFWAGNTWVLWQPFPGKLLMECLEYALIEKYRPVNNLHGRGRAAQRLAQWFLDECVEGKRVDVSRPGIGEFAPLEMRAKGRAVRPHRSGGQT